jgi:hypothetical protein
MYQDVATLCGPGGTDIGCPCTAAVAGAITKPLRRFALQIG